MKNLRENRSKIEFEMKKKKMKVESKTSQEKEDLSMPPKVKIVYWKIFHNTKEQWKYWENIRSELIKEEILFRLINYL